MTLATCQLLTTHMWIVTTVLDSVGGEHFQHHREIYWTMLLYKLTSSQLDWEFLSLPKHCNSETHLLNDC